MKGYSTRQVAKRLGLTDASISRYIAAKKIPAPPPIQVGALRVRIWTDSDIEKVRKILPEIPNGRKTRYQKERAKKKGPKKSSKKR